MSSINKPILALLLWCMTLTTGWAATSPRDKSNGQQMYSGASMSCLMANDFYAVHFTALQHGRRNDENSEFIKYCQEIPATGKTYLTIDLMDRESRKLDISLRIIEEEYSADGKTYKTLTTLKETPPRIYKNGVADVHADLDHPGHYALMVTFGDENEATEDDRMRIPFSVGLPSPGKPKINMGMVATLAVIGFMAALLVAGYRSLYPGKAGNTLKTLLGRQSKSM